MFKKKKDLPYNFDIDEEYKQYKNIGNHDSKIKTYIEWEHYIRNKFIPFTEIVRLNFIHFIKREKRREERSLATLDAIWMPLNIFVLTVFMTFMFACAEVIKNYNADLSNVVNNYFITNSDMRYQEAIMLLEVGFKESVIFYGFFASVTLVVGVLLYVVGKNRRMSISDKISFYEDIMILVEKDNCDSELCVR